MDSKSENVHTAFSCSSNYLRILFMSSLSLDIFEYRRDITDARRILSDTTAPKLRTLYLQSGANSFIDL
jgi:hypothetical protein